MSIDAMKQALEALEYIYTETTEDEDELIHAAIPALRLAIEQAEHELRRLHAENEDHIQQLRKEQLEVERMHRVNAQLLEALGNLEEYSKRMGNVASNLAANQMPKHLNASEYERGFIDGMQKQMQSSVDKAVNRMATPQQIEKLEAQLGEAVWNYGEAKRLNAQLLEALESMVASCWSDGFTNRKYNSDEHEENVRRDLVLAAIAAAKEMK